MTNPAPNETDFATLMEELPGGGLISDRMDTVDGFGIVETARGTGNGSTYGARDAGLTAHRGVLDTDAYIDPAHLFELVAKKLGFTAAEIEGAYKNGRPTPQRASMRAHIDGRLLALSRSGGNMLELARALGWPVVDGSANAGGGHCVKLERALARALAAEAAAA